MPPTWCASLILLPLLLCSASGADIRKSAAPAHDWPAWRGPDRTGRSSETGLLSAWPEGGPKLLWTAVGLGDGFSTPSIAGKLIYVMGNRDGNELVLALDRTSQGKIVWQHALGPVRHDGGGYPGPRSTPTVDGRRVYALGLNGDLVCLDALKGGEQWRHNLKDDFDGQVGGWGYSESVLVDGPWVVCTPGGKRATLVALNKTNGQPVWEAPVGDVADYASILPIEVAGLRQYVQLTKQGVVGVKADDGTFLWRYNAPANGTANAATPLFANDSVFAASNYGQGGGRVGLTREGDAIAAEQIYFTKKMKNHHGGMVLIDGYLYGADDSLLTCLDFKTGEVKWQDRAPGKCSIVYADGMLYCRNEGGPVMLVKATPDGFQPAGRFEQPDRSQRNAWPHPVIADGRLYLRDQDKLFCYDVRAN
jgi:outer membrane protein assembly factor BamB